MTIPHGGHLRLHQSPDRHHLHGRLLEGVQYSTPKGKNVKVHVGTRRQNGRSPATSRPEQGQAGTNNSSTRCDIILPWRAVVRHRGRGSGHHAGSTSSGSTRRLRVGGAVLRPVLNVVKGIDVPSPTWLRRRPTELLPATRSSARSTRWRVHRAAARVSTASAGRGQDLSRDDQCRHHQRKIKITYRRSRRR